MNNINGYVFGNQWSNTADIYSGSNENKTKTSQSSAAAKQKGGKVTVRKTIKAAGYMMRIAQARTPAQVSGVIRTARADMQFVKSCNSREGDTAKAMRILKQVVAKSKVKIQKLKSEEELEKQERLARSAKKKKLEEQIRKKKNKQRKERTAKEAADTCNNEEATVSKTTYIDGTGIVMAADDSLGVSGNAMTAESIPSAETVISAEGIAAGSYIEAAL